MKRSVEADLYQRQDSPLGEIVKDVEHANNEERRTAGLRVRDNIGKFVNSVKGIMSDGRILLEVCAVNPDNPDVFARVEYSPSDNNLYATFVRYKDSRSKDSEETFGQYEMPAWSWLDYNNAIVSSIRSSLLRPKEIKNTTVNL